MADWMVVASFFDRDGEAICAADRMGYNTYQPLYREREIARGRRTWQTKKLFGTLFFVEIGADWLSQYVSLVTNPWIRKVLTAAEKPLVAQGHEIERFRSSEVRGYVPIKIRREFQRGQKVRLIGGPLTDFEATYDDYDEDHVQDKVFVNLFGKLIPIRVDPGLIVPSFV